MHRRLLTAPCSASLKRNLEVTDESTTDVFSDEKALSPVKIETCKKKNLVRKKRKEKVGKRCYWELWNDKIQTPFEAFCKIFSDELLDLITIQTISYANQHKELYPPVTNKAAIVVLSFILLSGYCKVPYREL